MPPNEFTDLIETEAELIDRMTMPSPAVTEAVGKLQGKVMILGIAGKMGPTLGELLKRAGAEVLGVSRFSDPNTRRGLEERGIETVPCDLLDEDRLRSLPGAPHIVLMAGFKFGSSGDPSATWAANAMLPARVLQRFPDSQVIYLSSGNVYPFTTTSGKGADESHPVDPVGEYAQSRLGGERLAQHEAERNGTPLLLVRLFYASELRYGIVLDLAQKIWERTPIDLEMGYVNQIWQGDANAYLAQMFPLCETPARVINMTGDEVLSVRALAVELGRHLNVEPLFQGRESETALVGDATALFERLGRPTVPVSTLVSWVAHWVKHGRGTLGKPTGYESRSGKF
jgi:nucleoside-diphosphate-sugar epimerase